MTKQEFDKGFTAGMKAKYNNSEWDVASCDFEEYTIGLLPINAGPEVDILWLKCEEVEIIK